MRWLSPLFLVSLGLHGLGLFMPVPKAAEVPEEVEELTLESIPVSILPAEPLPSTAPTIPAKPLPNTAPTVPAELASPPVVEPAILEPTLDPSTQLEPQPTPSSEPQTEQGSTPPPSEPLESAKPEKQAPPISQTFDPVDADASPSAYLAAFTAFTDTVKEIDDTIVIGYLRKESYELDYLGDLCFPDKESVAGAVGVVLNSTPQVQVGKIITGTGFTATNEAVNEWFADLESGGEGNTAEIEGTFDQPLYEWISDQKNGVLFVENKNYAAYQFGIVVNLINNPCK